MCVHGCYEGEYLCRKTYLCEPNMAQAQGIRIIDVRHEVNAVFAADAGEPPCHRSPRLIADTSRAP